MGNCLIIIPTFNEIENIANIIDATLTQDSSFDILVVDDGSPDGTGAKVKEIQQTTDRVHLIERQGKLGLGTAYLRGFKFGIAHKYDYIFEMDADFSHPVKALKHLKAICENNEADVAVGSRYVKGGNIKNWNKYRLMLSFGASIYVRLITGLSVKDPTGGFVCYKREVLEAINLDDVRSIGYAFQIEMKYTASKLGFRIKEYPITFIDRELGTSKMNTSIVKEAMLGVIRLRSRKF